jgi:hypothetical protein
MFVVRFSAPWPGPLAVFRKTYSALLFARPSVCTVLLSHVGMSVEPIAFQSSPASSVSGLSLYRPTRLAFLIMGPSRTCRGRRMTQPLATAAGRRPPAWTRSEAQAPVCLLGRRRVDPPLRAYDDQGEKERRIWNQPGARRHTARPPL